jgi:hypothetical protein
MTPAMSPSSQPTLWRTCRVLANRKRLQTLALLIQQPNQTVSTVAEHELVRAGCQSILARSGSAGIADLPTRWPPRGIPAVRGNEQRCCPGNCQSIAPGLPAESATDRSDLQTGNGLHASAKNRGVSRPDKRRGFVCQTTSGNSYPSASALPASRETGGKRLCEE